MNLQRLRSDRDLDRLQVEETERVNPMMWVGLAYLMVGVLMVLWWCL